jgi:fibronectin-binding autotransporter adhesin
VGDSGTGTLNVTGGSVSCQFFSAGFFAGATGTVTVSGVGSSLTNSGTDFRVGLFGTGTLNITAGGTVSTGRAAIAQRSGSNGAVTVAGANSVWNILARLSVGGNAASGVAGGTGTLNIDPGGTVLVAQDIVLFPDGTVKLQGGNLAALAVGFQGGGDFDWTSGTLQVDTFNGDLVNQGGTLLPGSGNETNIAGSYTQQPAGVMQFAIGGTTPVMDFNQVAVDDVASLNGTLDVSLRGGFMPSAGEMFEIITATGGRTGMFATGLLPMLAGALDWNVIYGANAVTLEVVVGLAGDYNDDGSVDAADYVVWRKTDGTPSGYNTWRANFGQSAGGRAVASANAAVPEPSTLVMLVLAAAGVCSRRRWTA